MTHEDETSTERITNLENLFLYKLNIFFNFLNKCIKFPKEILNKYIYQ